MDLSQYGLEPRALPLEKPRAVTLAERALWVWTAWIAIYGVIDAMGTMPHIDADLQAALPISMDSIRGLTIAAYLLVAASVAGLALQIGAGKRWARFTLLVSFVLELMFDADQNLHHLLLDVPDILLQLYALVLIYGRTARPWFMRPKTQLLPPEFRA